MIDHDIFPVIIAGMSLTGTVFSGVLTYLMILLNHKLSSQKQKLVEIENTTEKVHVLVNSSMGAQLKLTAVVSRRLAELTKHKSDYAAADMADKLLFDHERKQTIVDAKKEVKS